MAWDSWFSDWGAASWSEEVEAADQQAREWVDATSRARGWSDYWRDSFVACINAALASDADTAVAYWLEVTRLCSEWIASVEAGGVKPPDGVTKLRDTFASAAGAATTTAAGRDEGSVSAVVGGTVAGVAEDIATATNPRRSWVPWGIGAALLAGLAYAVRR